MRGGIAPHPWHHIAAATGRWSTRTRNSDRRVGCSGSSSPMPLARIDSWMRQRCRGGQRSAGPWLRTMGQAPTSIRHPDRRPRADSALRRLGLGSSGSHPSHSSLGLHRSVGLVLQVQMRGGSEPEASEGRGRGVLVFGGNMSFPVESFLADCSQPGFTFTVAKVIPLSLNSYIDD